MRLVLDTNILISALFWEGNERRLLWDCKRKKHQLVISPYILEEMSRVLDEKFKLPVDKRRKYTEDILLIADVVFPAGNIHAIKDHPADDIILETAIIGKADMLITGDKHLLSLKRFRGVRIGKTSRI